MHVDSRYFLFLFAFLLLVFRPSCDAKQLEFYEDRVPKSYTTGVQSGKNKNLKDSVHQEPTSDGNLASNHVVERPKNNSGGKERASEVSTSSMSGHDSIRIDGKEQKADDQHPAAMTSTPKTEDLAQLPLVNKYTGITPIKEEVSLLCFSFIGMMDWILFLLLFCPI